MSKGLSILSIYEDIWDSRIYRNTLILWYMDGVIEHYDWKRLMSRIEEEDYLTEKLDRNFETFRDENSRSFNNHNFDKKYHIKLRGNERFKSVIKARFETKYFPIDSEIIAGNLFTLNETGLYKSHYLNEERNQISDCPGIHLIGSVQGLSVSAGVDGLFYFDSTNTSKDFILNRITSNFSSWISNYQTPTSIFASTENGNASIVNINGVEVQEEEVVLNQNYDLIWGNSNKIYALKQNSIDVYSTEKNTEKKFIHLENIPFQRWKGNILSAKNSSFGLLIECENALVVKQTNRVINLEYPVKFRDFPHSGVYRNHLHVVFEKFLNIYIFH